LAIFRPYGDGHLAYLMLLSVPRDGNHGLENIRYLPSLGMDS